ncbi:transcriptional regulator [Clostridium gelidum]|uniref:Transcriptional regulator n=1 Tax=Clostridium gelidum TaxID=704125 RepID=A0ABM7T1A7_9CLOT|nr:Rrf2 family transcriptional regulator [Clostridium gelidum]BCZ45673.1 transcriptional regulator [Clostridium gelidum]
MKISSRFSVAVHIISILQLYGNPMPTSEYIAGSVNTNPVVIRRILGMLKQAGMVDMKRGTGGAYLVKSVEDITMLDVYKAVGSVEDGQLFQIHENPNPMCPVGANIQEVINVALISSQDAMEGILQKITLADITKNLAEKIED